MLLTYPNADRVVSVVLNLQARVSAQVVGELPISTDLQPLPGPVLKNNFLESSRDNDLPPVHYRNPVGKLLSLLQVVCSQQDGPAFPLQAPDNVPNRPPGL